MARRRKHSDAELVRAAGRAIATRGPHELTLADVAAVAGVAPATLVQRFGSKRDLLLAVAAAGPDVVTAAFEEARASSRTALGALESALVGLASSVEDPDEVANHVAFLALDLADPDFRGHAARDTGAFRECIDTLLKEAAAAGELTVSRRRPLVELLQAAYHGALLMWAIEREGSPGRRVREHIRLVLRPYRVGAA